MATKSAKEEGKTHRKSRLLVILLIALASYLAWVKKRVSAERESADPDTVDSFGTLSRGRPEPVKTDEGLTIHTEVVGDGDDALIYVHGYMANTDFWHHQKMMLQERGTAGCRHIFVDLRGHGHSSVPEDFDYSMDALVRDIDSVIKHHGADRSRFVIVGHSLGGMVALKLALEHEDRYRGRLSGMLLTNTIPSARLMKESMRFSGALDFAVNRLLPPITERARGFKLDRYSTRGYNTDETYAFTRRIAFGKKPDPTAVLCLAKLGSLAAPDISVLRLIHGLAYFDVSGSLERIDMPVQIVAGGSDPLTAPEMSYYMNRHIAGSELEVFESAGHVVPIEHGEEYNEILWEFIHRCLGDSEQESPG